MTFDQDYFHSARYAKVAFTKYSQYWWSNRYYALLSRKHGPKKGRVLEVGCGLGHLLGFLTDCYQVHGGDVNEWAIEQAGQNVPDGQFYHLDAQDLSIFPDGHFNILIAKHVVEHLPQPEKAISEMGRVLAGNGLLILGTPNLDSPMRQRKGRDWVGYQDPTHISLKHPAEWLDLIRKAGMLPQKMFSDGFWDPPYLPYIPNILQKLISGLPGGLQAVLGWSFLPLNMGESMIVLANKINS